MKDFKFFRDNTLLFEGREITEVRPLMYNPESFVNFVDIDGSVYRITIGIDHPQWNELRERYP